jgi:hypothetical protein
MAIMMMMLMPITAIVIVFIKGLPNVLIFAFEPSNLVISQCLFFKQFTKIDTALTKF